jgi:predicted nucleotidyltransferase
MILVNDVENATKLLKDEGCEAVFLFGSLVTGRIHDNSDIDIGIKGYPTGKFFRLYSKWKIIRKNFELFIESN